MAKATIQNTTKRRIDMDFISRCTLLLASGIAVGDQSQVLDAAKAIAAEVGMDHRHFGFDV